MSFEKVILKNGEGRSDFIRKRLKEGVGAKAILGEINSPELYSGPEGKQWNRNVVDGLKPKTKAVKAEAWGDELIGKSHPPKAVVGNEEIPSADSLLTEAERLEIVQQAYDDVLAEKRKDAKKTLLEREKARISGKTGLKTGDPAKDQLVDVTIDLPEFGGKYGSYIQFNMPHGQKYHHNCRYQVPKHVADQLREVMARNWQHQAELDGKRKNAYARKQNLTIVGGESTGAPPMVIAGGGVTV